MKAAIRFASLTFTLLAGAIGSSGAVAASAEEIVKTTCNACHQVGVLGAPKTGSAEDWAPRSKKGTETLVKNAINGINAMPPRGGNATLSDADVKAAVEYFLAQAKQAAKPAAAAAKGASGADVVAKNCNACHQVGVLGAPKTGSAEDWAPRAKKGKETLLKSAINGFNAMPPRGGNATLTDAELKAAVEFFLAEAQKAAPAKPAVKAEAKAEPPKPKPELAKAAGAIAAPAAKVNTFNRLMAPPSKRNPAPPEDGIHDPANDGTHALQPPRDAFEPLPKANSGNRVDWVKSLGEEKIAPRYDRLDPAKQPIVMDLNIVREVKGSMPNVVYPHKQHTEWLDCSNCHPAIFIPKKGANQISMASILLGEKCGVCHGKVAFPIGECRKCHSQSKTASGGR